MGRLSGWSTTMAKYGTLGALCKYGWRGGWLLANALNFIGLNHTIICSPIGQFAPCAIGWTLSCIGVLNVQLSVELDILSICAQWFLPSSPKSFLNSNRHAWDVQISFISCPIQLANWLHHCVGCGFAARVTVYAGLRRNEALTLGAVWPTCSAMEALALLIPNSSIKSLYSGTWQYYIYLMLPGSTNYTLCYMAD